MELTIRELAAAAADAVQSANVRGANRRVTELPDERTIRWYSTIGLLDRPVGSRGRTALYGERHVLQLVAIKRLQAEGRTLAEIQEQLVGATDRTLRRVAGVDGAVSAPPRQTAPIRLTTSGGRQAAPAASREFWRQQPARPVEPADAVLTGVELGDGVLLMLPRRPDPSDLDAIQAAAQPLLDLLAAHRLTRGSAS